MSDNTGSTTPSEFDEHKSHFIEFLKKSKDPAAKFVLECFKGYLAPLLDDTREELADVKDDVENILDQMEPAELRVLTDMKTALVMNAALIEKLLNAAGFIEVTSDQMKFTDKCPKDIVEAFGQLGEYNSDLVDRIDEQIEEWNEDPPDDAEADAADAAADKTAA